MDNKTKHLDLGSSAFWVLFSVLVAWGSYHLRLGTLHKPGAGFLPFLAACVLAGLSLILLIQSFLKRGEEEPGTGPEKVRWPKALLIPGFLLGYALGLERLGFVITTFLLLFLLLKLIEPQSWPRTILIALLGSVFSYLFFQSWLQVQLPQGLLSGLRF